MRLGIGWLLVAVAVLAGCGSKPRVHLPPPTPARVGAVEYGMASWYGHPYHGRRTSNGEVYDMHLLTAAHLSLPFGTHVRVTNLRTGRNVLVRINDRGPFVKDRAIDLSREAARALGMLGPGTDKVSIEVVAAPGMPLPSEEPQVVLARSDDPTQGALFEEDVENFNNGEGACSGGPFYAVQVGSFRVLENAERMQGKMIERYGVATVVSVPTQQGPVYRVMVGQIGDGASARRLLNQIQEDSFDGLVMRVDESAAHDCL
jgi:rare lipoprotein A